MICTVPDTADGADIAGKKGTLDVIITVTERGTYKRCQRQWHLTSKNGKHLTPIVSAPALNIGTLIHKAGERWIVAPTSSYEAHVLDAAVEMEEAIRKQYKARIGANPSDVEMDSFREQVAMAHDMAHNYQVRWGTPIPDGFALVQPEQKVQIPIPNTMHACEMCDGIGYMTRAAPAGPITILSICADCNGAGEIPHYLEGKLDGLIQRTDGTIWVYERKTYGQRPKVESLQYNDQFLAYTWMLRQLKIADVGGIAYDGLWKRAEPPRGKTMEDLFLRHLLTRSNSELDEFERLLSVEVMEMAATQDRGEYTINRQWQGCWDCGMQKLCYAMSRNESPDAVQHLYYTERTDDSEAVEEEVAA